MAEFFLRAVFLTIFLYIPFDACCLNSPPFRLMLEALDAGDFSFYILREFPPLNSFTRLFHGSPCKNKKCPSEWDLATGVERWEACQHAKGNTDPFFNLPVAKGPGTKDCPIVVPSVLDRRLIMCVCDRCNNGVTRFYLHEGFPRRCLCNKWFVMERLPYPKVYEDEPDY